MAIAQDITNECRDRHAREIRYLQRLGSAHQGPLNWLTGDEDHEHVFALEEGRDSLRRKKHDLK
jgi:hypothetical protein